MRRSAKKSFRLLKVLLVDIELVHPRIILMLYGIGSPVSERFFHVLHLVHIEDIIRNQNFSDFIELLQGNPHTALFFSKSIS